VRRVRIHDLRHSFASTGIRQGVSLYATGKLLGHRQATTTQRYAHLERDATREALERVSQAIEDGKS
jgi:site-specific recombinase XerD